MARELIIKNSLKPFLLKLRWILYLGIFSGFFYAYIETQKIKNQYQKDIFAFYEANSAFYANFTPSKWNDKVPQFFLPICESWGQYSVQISSSPDMNYEIVKEFSYFDNIKTIEISNPVHLELIKSHDYSDILNLVSKIEDIKEISIYFPIGTKELISPLKKTNISSLNLEFDTIKSECIKTICSISSLESLSIYTSYGLANSEFSYVKNLTKLTELELEDDQYPYIESLESLKSLPETPSLKKLKINLPLFKILDHLDKFPGLIELVPDNYLVIDDRDIEILLSRKESNIKEIEIGPGVTLHGIQKLENLPKLEWINIGVYNNHKHIQWKRFKNLKAILLPSCTELKEFFSRELPPNLTTLYSPGSLVDIEVANLLKKNKIYSFPVKKIL